MSIFVVVMMLHNSIYYVMLYIIHCSDIVYIKWKPNFFYFRKTVLQTSKYQVVEHTHSDDVNLQLISECVEAAYTQQSEFNTDMKDGVINPLVCFNRI